METDLGPAGAEGARRRVSFHVFLFFQAEKIFHIFLFFFRSLEKNFELYNVVDDPGETNNLAKSKTKVNKSTK